MFGQTEVAQVSVSTVSGRGWTPEEIAERLVGRIVSVADTAPDPIRAQAHAFRDRLLPVCSYYLREAARSDRTTLCHTLREAGFPDAADFVGRL